MNDDPLLQHLRELCNFLENSGIEYMLVGGLAVGIWGAPRATVDIDFLVSFSIKDCATLRQKINDSCQVCVELKEGHFKLLPWNP